MNNQQLQEYVAGFSQDPNTRKIIRVACYVRVSTQEQKLHGISVDAQKEKLTEYAKEHKLKIAGWYIDEGVSGRKLIRKRPELQRMIRDAEEGLFDRIIFVKLDRFFRSVAEYHECMKRIDPVMWTATEEEYDLTTANGRAFVNMKLTIAELEADQGGERIDMVNEYKIQTGQPLTGSMPFCYTIVTDERTGRKKIVKNPEHEAMTYELIQYFMLHQNKKQTVHYINEKYELDIEYKTYTNVLKNSMLCGEYRGNPVYIEDPYIDRKAFDLLQEIMKKNISETKTKRCYLFTGLIRCPECGHTLKSAVLGNYGKYGTAAHKTYRCSQNHIHRRCGFNKQVYEATVEKLMLKNMEQYFQDAKVRSVEITDSTVKKAKPDIAKIQIEIDRLNYSWRTGKIAKVEDYERDFEELKAKLEAAQKEEPDQPKDFSAIEELLSSNWRDIYEALDEQHRRAFWRKYIESIEIDWSIAGRGKKKITKVNFF